jgi:hypothetical protein
MSSKDYLKAINWTIFILVVLTAIITASITMYNLLNIPAFGEDAQSRAEFRWGSIQTFTVIALLISSVLLAKRWKRLFPFNVPIAIILVGFCYVLFFLTFTTGWVGFQGMFGFFIAFLLGMILSISYTIFNRIERRKMINKN